MVTIAAQPQPAMVVDSSADYCSSPEFEFWVVGNHPTSPGPGLLTADELFVDGVLLPLHDLSHPRAEPDEPKLQSQQQHERQPQPEPGPSASICSATAAAAPPSASKRWKDIFKMGEKKKVVEEKERKRERKGSSAAAASAGGSAELNINIWPFSRSRSAGSVARPRAAAAARKVCSAPCSRSNSRGESPAAAARRWAPSPGRAGGVHLGRSSPVWQLRRAAPAPAAKEKTAAARVISLNVNTCIGYRSQGSCRTDDDGGAAEAGNGGSLFNLRALFSSSKKVY